MNPKCKFLNLVILTSECLLIYSCTPDVPIVETSNVTSITQNSAISGGNIKDNGGAEVTARGVCWSTATNPDISKERTNDGTGIGTYTSNISNLASNTKYYVRAYATNSAGTGYGLEITFTTNSILLANLTTTEVSSITSTSAVSGGNITSDGGGSVTSRGVCWSTTSNPDLSNNKTSDGTGTGPFTSNLTGLVTNTLYYVRAYATNISGTAYGNQVSFNTPLSDPDGNVYTTVSIGTQVWMTENLKTTKLNDNTVITNASSYTTWSGLSSPGYCWYDNDISYKSTYGALYNWLAVNTGKLCPAGWRVPSETDWTILVNFLGGSSVAGGPLKEAGTTHWNSPNTGATNSSGFSALPGGGRGDDGIFGFGGTYGNWWESTVENTNNAYYRAMFYNGTNVGRTSYNKKAGFSVRCIKN